MQSGRVRRLGDHCESFQGEVNETNDRKAGRISYYNSDGPEVIRGAHLCLYAIREASQGTAVFVRKDKYLNRPHSEGKDLKAFHHRYERIGYQRKSPQNNFRRLIAAKFSPDIFLLESISYIPSHKSKIDLDLVLALLNSKVCEWYFRLGSTNAMVGEYQFNNLPCPQFADQPRKGDDQLRKQALHFLSAENWDRIKELLRSLLEEPPFSPVLRDVIIEAVKRISQLEAERGDIARTERTALAPPAQPYQDLIDWLLYKMAGLTDDEAAGLEERLAKML